MTPDLSSRIRGVVAATFGVPPAMINDTSSNETIAEWDSMNHLHLVVALEAEFGVSFEPEQAIGLISVRVIEQVLRDAGTR